MSTRLRGGLEPSGEPRHVVQPGSAEVGETFEAARALVLSRSNVSPKRLVEPGPSEAQLDDLLTLAAAAPDHGMLTPWRFVVVPPCERHRLAEAFARSLVDRDPGATLDQIEAAREKAHRAPLLLVAIACLGPSEPDIPALERMVSMGAAVQNILLGAHAMGFGAGLTSGQAMSSPHLGALCDMRDGESAVCCINIGTVSKRKSAGRVHPLPREFMTVLGNDRPPRLD